MVQVRERDAEENKPYDVDHVYRTEQKRSLSQFSDKFVANSFGFADKIGEGKSVIVQVVHDKKLD